MKKILLTTVKILGLLLLLPIGSLGILVIESLYKTPCGSVTGFGWQHGYFQACLSSNGKDHSFCVYIKGESPPRWHWRSTDNYQYPILDISLPAKDETTLYQLDTAAMTLKMPGHTIPVSRESLSRLLFELPVAELPPADLEAIDALQRFFAEAGAGQLPVPANHHDYHFEKPLSGHMQHFALGWFLPYFTYCWAAIWTMLCLALAARRLWKRKLGTLAGTAIDIGGLLGRHFVRVEAMQRRAYFIAFIAAGTSVFFQGLSRSHWGFGDPHSFRGDWSQILASPVPVLPLSAFPEPVGLGLLLIFAILLVRRLWLLLATAAPFEPPASFTAGPRNLILVAMVFFIPFSLTVLVASITRTPPQKPLLFLGIPALLLQSPVLFYVELCSLRWFAPRPGTGSETIP